MSSEEFSRLIEQVLPALELYARQWSSEPADVVQEAFLRLWNQQPPPGDARAWLFRVVRNLSISRSRADSRRKEREESHAQNIDNWFEQEAGQELDAADVTRRLRELPDELREPVIARLWGELSFEEVGELIGISSTTAHRRYQEAMRRLRTELDARQICRPNQTEPTIEPATTSKAPSDR